MAPDEQQPHARNHSGASRSANHRDPSPRPAPEDGGPLGQRGFEDCAELTFRLGLCPAFRERPGFRSLLLTVASSFRDLVGEEFGGTKLPSEVQRMLLGRLLVPALRERFNPEIASALRRTPPERQEDLFGPVRVELDPPADQEPEQDPAAFFDAWSWNFSSMAVTDPHEVFVRLVLIAEHLAAVERGMTAEDMTPLEAATTAFRLREDWINAPGRARRFAIRPPQPLAPMRREIQMLAEQQD